eukprot:305521_1
MSDSSPFEALVILLHSISGIFCLVLVLILANNTCCIPFDYRPKVANGKILLFSYGALISFGFSSLTNILRLSEIKSITDNKIMYSILYESCLYFWRIGQICVYMLFIMRMKYSFSTTKYQSPSWHFIILYSLMFLFLFIQIIFSCEDYIFFHSLHILSSSFNSKFEAANIWFTGIVDLIISISLLYLFYSKLIRLNIDIVDGMKQSASKNNLSTPNTTNSELIISRQQTIIGIMSKFTILSSIVIICSQLFCMSIGLGYWLCPGNNSDDTNNQTQCMKSWRNAWRSYWAIANIINCLCIFLSFDFLTLSYYKLCGLCDHCCRSCMKNTFNKQTQQIITIIGQNNFFDNHNVFVSDKDKKQPLLDVPLSVSTNEKYEQRESTDMAYHHTMVGTVSSINDITNHATKSCTDR